MQCSVDLDGLNEYGRPQNKWKKYLEFDDDGKKLESNGEYFKPITKNRGKKQNCHATLRINSVEFEAKYLFVRPLVQSRSYKYMCKKDESPNIMSANYALISYIDTTAKELQCKPV
jgi:hypothetical protein